MSNLANTLTLAALVSAFVLLSCRNLETPSMPQPHPLPFTPVPDHQHAGGPGCDNWAIPLEAHQELVPRPLSIGGAGDGGTAAGTVRVLTLNVHHCEAQTGGLHYFHLADLIASQSPDVVILQELDRGTLRSVGTDQAAILADLLGMDVAYGPAMDWLGGEYGDAILSRWPIIASESHQLPFLPSLEPRQALAARILPGGGLPEFLVLGTHLDHMAPSMRLAQMRELDRIAGESLLPVILGGDFNAPRGDACMRWILDEWDDAGSPDARIDHVLVRQEWEILKSWVLEDPQLDHPALMSVLGWTP